MISVERLSHRYGTLAAVENVSFTVGAGEVVGLVGPNGAGKSTLMKAAATLLEQTSGRVTIDGFDTMSAPSDARKRLGFLPERSNLDPDLMVWEVLDLYADIAGYKKAHRPAVIEQCTHDAGLDGRREQLVKQLSKGLKQRLALQTALLSEPQVLILDEPTDGLDPKGRYALLDAARKFADKGRAVLLSSHVLDEVEQVADRSVILVGGRLVDEDAGARSAGHIVRVSADIDGAVRLLEQQAFVARCVRVDDHLALELADGSADAPDVAQLLVNNGFRLVELREAQFSLRDQFDRVVEDAEGRTS